MAVYTNHQPTLFSEFRVVKARTEATLTLSNGTSVDGYFFVTTDISARNGPEPIRDVLNAERGFFPFRSLGPDGARDVLYNPDHVIVVALRGSDEAQRDAGYDVATKRGVSMLLSNGQCLRGTVSVHRPRGRDRLSDFARTPGRFKYLVHNDVTLLVNVTHVRELVEENPKL